VPVRGTTPSCKSTTSSLVSLLLRRFFVVVPLNPPIGHFAPTLHTIYSTGAVLTSSLASWVAKAFGPVCQIQFSGGTELCGSFFHGTRSLPSYAGECAVKELGMDMDVFDDHGNPAKDGERGELVCKKGFPNMPVMFLNDPEKKRYHAAYFEGFDRKFSSDTFFPFDADIQDQMFGRMATSFVSTQKPTASTCWAAGKYMIFLGFVPGSRVDKVPATASSTHRASALAARKCTQFWSPAL
jgi:acyl-CoA synthetase (AMP-forming)/AMP-acid ligase II